MRISLPVGGLFCPVPTSAGLDKSIHPNSNPHTDRKSCQAGQCGEYVARRRRGRGGQMFIRPIIVGDLQRLACQIRCGVDMVTEGACIANSLAETTSSP